MSRVRPAVLLILAMAICAMISHVCAPVVGHVMPVMTHDGGHHHHDAPAGDDHPGDSFHAASCEALRPGTVQAPPIPIGPTVGAMVCTSLPLRAVEPRPVAAATNSPPIFLLHAALLL